MSEGEFKDIAADGFWFLLKHYVKARNGAERESLANTGSATAGGGKQGAADGGPTSAAAAVAAAKKTFGRSEPSLSKLLSVDPSDPLADPHMSKYGDPYFQRLSLNYVKLFTRIPFSSKDYFFGHFSHVLTFALLHSLKVAYPKSRVRFDDAHFRQLVLDVCSEWSTGFRPSKSGGPTGGGKSWIFAHPPGTEGGGSGGGGGGGGPPATPGGTAVMTSTGGGDATAQGNRDATGGQAALDHSHGGTSPGKGSMQMHTQLMGSNNNNGNSNNNSAEDDGGRPVRLSHVLGHSPLMSVYLSRFGDVENLHLKVKLGLTFSPHRPITTFNNGKVMVKVDLALKPPMPDADGKVVKSKRYATKGPSARVVVGSAEDSRNSLMRAYLEQKRACDKNIVETKAWELQVLAELKLQEKTLMKSEKTDFANVLVCKALEDIASGHSKRKSKNDWTATDDSA